MLTFLDIGAVDGAANDGNNAGNGGDMSAKQEILDAVVNV